MMMTRGKWLSFIFGIKYLWAYAVLLLLVVGGFLVVLEIQTSTFQAHYFSNLSSKANFTVGTGASSAISFPASAPYDDRLGYSKIPKFVEKLKSRDFEITRQAQISAGMADIVNGGYFAPYSEKIQGGLRILDCRNDSLFQERYPERIFERFEDISPMLVQSLLFIENRELLDPEHPKRNPAVEWDRLANALLLKAKGSLTGDSRSPGGSTLATQIEKYQHSSEGRTASVHEKLQQMVSAALRAYQHGEDTSAVRRQIVLTYMNTMPLSAKAGFGEVHGLGDGLWVW
jgi:membrane peptidoglycan carboxypeptidase